MGFSKTMLMMALLTAAVTTSPLSMAADGSSKTIKFNYNNAELTTVLQDYSKITGQKFIVDPAVHGKVTILNNDSVSMEEAFNQLSTALALNGLGFSTQGDVMVVMQARALQRNFIPTVSEVPPLKPERMTTWIYTFKYVSADDINRQLRILTSKDGELVPFTPTNQMIVSDWSSNLQRIAAIIHELDVPRRTPAPTAPPKAMKK